MVEGAFELAPRLAQGCGARDGRGQVGVEFGEGWVDDPSVGLGEQDGDHASVVGQLVATGACDEALAAQAPQVIGGLARRSAWAANGRRWQRRLSHGRSFLGAYSGLWGIHLNLSALGRKFGSPRVIVGEDHLNEGK